jgi:hypothetical protein
MGKIKLNGFCKKNKTFLRICPQIFVIFIHNNIMNFRMFFCFFLFHVLFMSVQAKTFEVKGAGTTDVNGIYIQSDSINGKPCYVKGSYTILYKGCFSKWMITSPSGNVYRNAKNTGFPPKQGWERGCAAESKDPAPVIIEVNDNKY